MIGLGTMGRNFLLNVAEHGITGVGYDLDPEKRRLLLQEGSGMPVGAADDIEDLLAKLSSPRNIMLLVPAGPVVDSVINDLAPHLDKDDLIIDGGNSHFADTERRQALLSEKGIGFMGVGVSGGEEGARHGASIMPGGTIAHFERVRPALEAVSAKVDGEPCVAYMGRGSAGHFVKMVHNGIEYGLMQILAETYDFMLRVLKLDYKQMSETFAKWNGSKLNSYLVEITAEVLRKVDAETGTPLVELILDQAAQKGTGKWTSQAAMDLGVPIPTIDSAVSMRQISAQKQTRIQIARAFGKGHQTMPDQEHSHGEAVSSEEQFDMKAELAREDVRTTAADQIGESRAGTAGTSGETAQSSVNKEIRRAFKDHLDGALESLRKALLCSFVVTYAQGMSLLQVAAKEKEYGTDLAAVARIWRGGCIIRSALLGEISAAFEHDPELANLILDGQFRQILSEGRIEWHEVAGAFSRSRIPALCLNSALAYFEAFRSERLPANLIQAQRDLFGAHTYQRVDRDGTFHTPDWSS